MTLFVSELAVGFPWIPTKWWRPWGAKFIFWWCFWWWNLGWEWGCWDQWKGYRRSAYSTYAAICPYSCWSCQPQPRCWWIRAAPSSKWWTSGSSGWNCSPEHRAQDLIGKFNHLGIGTIIMVDIYIYILHLQYVVIKLCIYVNVTLTKKGTIYMHCMWDISMANLGYSLAIFHFACTGQQHAVPTELALAKQRLAE